MTQDELEVEGEGMDSRIASENSSIFSAFNRCWGLQRRKIVTIFECGRWNFLQVGCGWIKLSFGVCIVKNVLPKLFNRRKSNFNISKSAMIFHISSQY